MDLDLKRVALGERLFNDVRLSRDNTKSCAACHPLDQGGMDGRRSATSANDSSPARNTPTIFNVGFNASFNWDGIAQTLEAQAEIVLLSPRLMNTTWPELLTKLRADADYVARFNNAYPEGLARANVLAALAIFERSLLTPNARFDRYLRGEQHALTEAEQHGYGLFKSYGCVACHQGMNIGGTCTRNSAFFRRPVMWKSLAPPSIWALRRDQGAARPGGVPRAEPAQCGGHRPLLSRWTRADA